MQTLLDKTYSSPGGSALRYDLFRPNVDGKAPLLVCIHGGGWISGEKEGMRDVAQAFNERGFATACPEYRLAPLHPYPAAIEDIREFIRFVKSNADELSIDATRIATLGNSAGGHLAAMAGLSPDKSQRAAAVVAICPITDLTRVREQHFPIAWSFLEQFMGAAYETNEEAHRDASPLYQVTPDAPPFLIVHGIDDDIVPVAQSDAFAEALSKAGVPVDYYRLPNESHGLTYEAWSEVEGLAADFLKRNLAI